MIPLSDNAVYPVYILKRVVDQILDHCSTAVPREAMGVLLGWHCRLPNRTQDTRFSKVVDWVTGDASASHVGAKFTEKGIEEYNLLLDEKFGEDRPSGPFNIGIFHSHPFGKEPHFSSTDYSTFLSFPYNAENNVFVLVDPVPKTPFFKVFQIKTVSGKREVSQVQWVSYSPVEEEFRDYAGAPIGNVSEHPIQESLPVPGSVKATSPIGDLQEKLPPSLTPYEGQIADRPKETIFDPPKVVNQLKGEKKGKKRLREYLSEEKDT
ncbi:MAG TPA: Mov34/MPN/PAD-1 family protein [Candidatus Hodarchaeales archaeon]|nr:Mov34/MPN/PAD-1 family protein [Candidatus Hodarchaeales archaeon]